MSHQVKACGFPDCYRFKLDASAGSEATKLMFFGITSPVAIRWVIIHLCTGAGFQAVLKVKLADFIIFKQSKI